MRVKKEQLIITFPTTSDAIRMEKFCQEQQIHGRLIPLPTEISAGCGLSWKTEPGEQDKIAEMLETTDIRWETMQVICL